MMTMSDVDTLSRALSQNMRDTVGMMALADALEEEGRQELADEWRARARGDWQGDEPEDEYNAFDSWEFVHDGYVFHAYVVDDEYHGAPWEECDGHGPVLYRRHDYGDRVSKAPGEWILLNRSHDAIIYDAQEAMKIALRDGWGHGPDVPGETNRQKAARAVRADFEYLRGWCLGTWHYCAVVVNRGDKDASIGGIESTDNEYMREVAHDLASELID